VREWNILRHELEVYNDELLDKRYLVALTKCDLTTPEEVERLLAELPKNIPVMNISSLTNLHLTELKDRLWALLTSED